MQRRKNTIPTTFGAALRNWRRARKVSQLELALSAQVSQRHISWLETARSRPSREMVVRLSIALGIPLRERNGLLTSAGFSGVYAEHDLSDAQMAPVRLALDHMLRHHEPFPALVADRHWNVLLTNTAMDRLLSLGGDPDELFARVNDDGQRNLARLTLHPDGLRPFIANWDVSAPMMLHRLRHEAVSYGSAEDIAQVERLAELADLPADAAPGATAPLQPTLPLVLEMGAARLSLFSVISTFGTAQDVTADELRIESFFPADDDSATLLRSIAQAEH